MKMTPEDCEKLKARLRDSQSRPKTRFQSERPPTRTLWTFGEEESPELWKTPDGRIWQHMSVKSGEAVVVRYEGEFRPAQFVTITSSFGSARVVFEGDSETTLVYYGDIGKYVIPDLVKGQLLQSKEGKFYLVVHEPPGGQPYQIALVPCEADGTPLGFAPLTWFTPSKMGLTRIG